MRLVSFGIVLVSALSASSPAQAQSQGAPPASPAFPFSGEPTGSAGALSAALASMPIRLTLQGALFPVGRALPQCESRDEPAGNSVGGIPVQHFASLRLVPNLVLSGFSQQGCPIDSTIGGALTYSVAVAPSAWLVFSAGVYGAPALPASFSGAAGPPHLSAAGTADIVWKNQTGHSFSIGTSSDVGARRQLFTFGGDFGSGAR
jgi:hypothetical protein